MKNLLIFLLAFILFETTDAQKVGQALIDSINAELTGVKNDSVRVRLLSAVCYELRNINPREALRPGLSALELADRIHYEYGKGLAHYSLTFIYHILSRLPESIDHALKAQAIFEGLNDQNHICAIYLMLAYMYKDLDRSITMDYMQKARALLPGHQDVVWVIRNYGTLGNNYRNLGQFDSAEKYMSVSLTLGEKHSYYGDVMVARNRFGYLYMAQSKLDTAFKLIREGLAYFQSIGSTRMVAENCTSLGKIRLRQSRDEGSLRSRYLKEAENFALDGLKVSCQLGYLIQRYTASKLLSDIYSAEGRTDMALDYLRAAFSDYDSVYGAQVVSKAVVLSWKNEQKLKEKQVELLKLHNRQQLSIIFGAAFGIIILIVVVFVIIKSRRRQKRAYLLVNAQKEEISRVLAELESTNQELEAFSYSVSHDLRAPVRRIESLCSFLFDDYEKLLDEKGRQLLKHIGDSTTLMNSLIEDLLKLSRITRQTVSRSACNITEMAARICEDLKPVYAGKSFDITIEENLIVQADARLLQIALQNLIDNAWKYSSKTDNPEVFIRSEVKDHKKYIVISDNGVGFDMAMAGGLFTPFQRMHSDEHFKGTGIGLATVKRVIVKHGGTITAQSEPGKGTTFSFTV